MDKEKQIEEMARHLCCDYNENCYKDCNASHECYVEEVCRTLYNAGYRKQSEGEWEQIGLRDPKCSLCRGYSIEKSAFCPNCGAKMKGE